MAIIAFWVSSATGPAFCQVRWSALKPPPPLPANMTRTDELMSGDFDLRFRCQPRGAKNWKAVLLLDAQDGDNGYRLYLSPSRATITKVQLGLEREVGGAESGRNPIGGTIVVQRRDSSFRIFDNARLLLSAYEDTFREGGVAYGSVQDSVKFESFQVQPVEPIAFTDDFMRAEDEKSDWKPVSGSWQIKSLRNPLRSANAFTYLGKAEGRPALSVAGHWYWSDYRFGASVTSNSGRGVGLVACYRDVGDCLLFEFIGRTGKEAGKCRLVRVEHGVRKTLAEAPGRGIAGQWYRLGLAVRGRIVRAYVDDRLACTAQTEITSGGQVGLYTSDSKGAYFDDVWCESDEDMTFEFTHPGDLSTITEGAWRQRGGHWTVVPTNANDAVCEAQTASPARAVVGSPSWTDYTVSAEVGTVPSGAAGICFYYQNEGEHLLLRNALDSADTLELVKVANDQTVTLASARLETTTAPSRRLTARVDRNLITSYADGVKVFEKYDASLTGGMAGLYAENCGKAVFDDFSVSFTPPHLQPVFTVHEVFGGEVSMANWAASQSDWKSVTATVGGASVDCLWHRSPFFGDVEIEGEASLSKGSFALIISAMQTSPDSGYCLTAANNALVLTRGGGEVARCDLKGQGDTSTVRLRREGGAVIATVDGAPRFSYQDPQPLTGVNVGWYATGGAANRESIQVYSDTVATDTFRQSPTDWRTAGGKWTVKNRWQCDPRWSFFSGENFTGTAALWNKRTCEGDMTVEFAAGIMMSRNRGTYSDYGRDVNLTICSDGKNLDSGYSFVFAGWGNKKNAIVRQGTVVAEAPPPSLDDNIHRKWFLIRAEKRGGNLKYFIDDQLVCEYTDPDPLVGNRLALWTYRCGIMVSRFRVSAQNLGPRESASEDWPAVTRTFYNTGAGS